MKINSIMALLPKFFSIVSPRHFRTRLRFGRLLAAIQYLFRVAAIEWVTFSLYEGKL